VVLFALEGLADPQRAGVYPHHWIGIGQFNRFFRVAAGEGCRDVAFIGAVTRPALWKIRPDFYMLRKMPSLIQLYRGGDDYLLSGLARIFEQKGFRLIGPKEIATELIMPLGRLGHQEPNERARSDIVRGLALLAATSPFDIGQAVVVADNHVLAVEGPEGTDQILVRVAQLRRQGRIQNPGGVLVKAAKLGQDHRLDLPTIGPYTVDGAAAAGLSGIAVVAGSTMVAEPERIAAAADKAGLFVIGVDADGNGPQNSP
jgi:DUF1009 family protein